MAEKRVQDGKFACYIFSHPDEVKLLVEVMNLTLPHNILLNGNEDYLELHAENLDDEVDMDKQLDDLGISATVIHLDKNGQPQQRRIQH